MLQKIKDTYTALWALAQDADPVRVVYGTGVAVGAGPMVEGGMFYVQDGQGRIDVWRSSYDDRHIFEPHWHRNDGTELTVDELRHEMYALAHEYGHYCSWKVGTWALQQPALERFALAVREGRPAHVRDRDEVLAEEQGAWCSAHTILRSLAWTDWGTFVERATMLVETYADYPTYEELDRLYADVGGIAGVPESLLVMLPRHKFDNERAEAAAKLGYPAVAPILPHLLTWLQDCNWPVSRPVAAFLVVVGQPLVEPIRTVLRSRDEVWKYWILSYLVSESAPLRAQLDAELRRLAESPTATEAAEELPEIARGLLARLG